MWDDVYEPTYREMMEEDAEARRRVASGEIPPFDFCYFCKNECKMAPGNFFEASDCQNIKFKNWTTIGAEEGEHDIDIIAYLELGRQMG